jgi:putative molybdopterin biosynthesis protein
VGLLIRRGFRAKVLYVGSMGGAKAAARGECDVASVHLMDPATGRYNHHLLADTLNLLPGYRRMQGIVFREGDAHFAGKGLEEAIGAALADPDCVMVNRNAGSGTRVLIDSLLGPHRPAGYGIQTKSHNAVAAAVQQGRADWGVAIDTVARQYGLAFIELQEEHYDFIVPKGSWDRPAMRAFRELLTDRAVQEQLRQMGFRL